MGRASTWVIHAFIRHVLRMAEAASKSFEDVLGEIESARIEQTVAGKMLVGTSRAGVSVTYALPASGDFTIQDIIELCARIFDAIRILKPGLPAPVSDDDLVAALIARFRPIRSVMPDFSRLQV